MKSLKDLLNRKKSIRPSALDDQAVFFVFRRVIQDEFGQVGLEKFMPDYFSGKTVFIKSTSSIWASELFLNKNKIIRKMNAELGEGSIENIRHKI
jgi:hypothetical protein